MLGTTPTALIFVVFMFPYLVVQIASGSKSLLDDSQGHFHSCRLEKCTEACPADNLLPCLCQLNPFFSQTNLSGT